MNVVPIRPSNLLWNGRNSVAGTLVVELGLLGFGVAVYLGMTHALDLRGVWSLWSLVGFFTGMFFLNHYAPQAPPEIPGRLLALPILVFVLLSPWGNGSSVIVHSAFPLPWPMMARVGDLAFEPRSRENSIDVLCEFAIQSWLSKP